MFPMNLDRGTAGERGPGPKKGPAQRKKQAEKKAAKKEKANPLLRTDRKTTCLRLLALRSRAMVATAHPSRLQRRQLRTTDITQT